jgi:signal transduction histidine kinase
VADRRAESLALTARATRAPRSWRSLVLGGLLTAALTGLAGFAIEIWMLGWNDQAAFARVEAEVRARVDGTTAAVRSFAASLAGRRDLIQRARSSPDAVRELFDTIAGALAARPLDASGVAVTVYDVRGTAVAWAGRPSDLPIERVGGPASVFVTPGSLGLRVVAIEPVFHPAATEAVNGSPPPRIGAVAVERLLSPDRQLQDPGADSYRVVTRLATVLLRARYEGAGDKPDPTRFVVASPGGEPLLEGIVSPTDLAAARAQWRRDVAGVVLAILGATLLVAIGPLRDRRAALRKPGPYLGATVAIAGLIVAARIVLWLAAPARWTGPPLFSPSAYASAAFGVVLRSPIDFLLTGLTALAFSGLAVVAVANWRLSRRGARRGALAHPWTFFAIQLLAGAAVGVLLAAYEAFLSDTVDNATIDVLQFSLHSWNPARLALVGGLLMFHAAVAWAAVALLLAGLSSWRFPRRDPRVTILAVLGWMAPLVPLALVISGRGLAVPMPQIWLAVAVCALAALLASRGRAPYRHTSQAARLVALFLAIAIPALLFYPSILHYAEQSRRRLIETQYAVQAARHPQELQVRLAEARRQIDGLSVLQDLVSASGPVADAGPAPTDSAFLLWRQTDLAEFRLTSAIELYNAEGALVSRFALNLPEYAPTSQAWRGRACEWDVFGEAAPFGSEERRMLHAERAVCGPDGAAVGAVVVHVMLDYNTLPFISSQSPYFEFFRPTPPPVEEGAPGRDVELVIYGWGRLPIYASADTSWELDEALFARIAASRQPFWATLARGGTRHAVYFLNDRVGIYAVGFPVRSVFDHLVAVAELTNLSALAYLVLLGGAGVFSYLTRGEALSGRVLMREIRQSYYRKLFLAFVAAAVVPVLILAFVIRAYFATLLATDVEAEAARTAAVAKRVIEESIALQQRGAESLASVGDEEMVSISQLIDQDVNIFAGPRLVATSERDLFASGLLPTRTPDAAYRAIVLQRLPRFVGEDAIGSFRYMLAAAPVRLGGREAILTVPMASRQQEIEREVDDLDRGVYLAALVFVVLGAAIGFYMAERIGDPVTRLTRATRRIARGDFDAAVTVRSIDELQRLVEAFNRMAAELKVQRTQLERTHRLEAWADMARQVAHEIKNPLTPIQLSAEHLRRVHADRGAPLGPVVEGCVESILNQVRILRQISAEFSSFAASPTARPEPTAVPDLLREVVDPYRAGLQDRVTLVVDAPDGLPRVHADRTLVGRALTNVIENALHAMPGGGRFTIAARAEGDFVRIDATDTGVGMDEAALTRIFEPYFSTKAIGTGLGLTIAKRNIELLGGAIAVRSDRGKGTTVTITLPVAPAAVARPNAEVAVTRNA